jgi:small subunit ribosomal protein S17
MGRVVSDKMDKTVVVMVERLLRHPLYERVYRRRGRLVAHDPENRASVGDVVEVMETRPLSRTKRWRLVRVITQAIS